MLDYLHYLNPARAQKLDNDTILQNMAMVTIYYTTTSVMVSVTR